MVCLIFLGTGIPCLKGRHGGTFLYPALAQEVQDEELRVQGQPVLYKETLSKNILKMNNEQKQQK